MKLAKAWQQAKKAGNWLKSTSSKTWQQAKNGWARIQTTRVYQWLVLKVKNTRARAKRLGAWLKSLPSKAWQQVKKGATWSKGIIWSGCCSLGAKIAHGWSCTFNPGKKVRRKSKKMDAEEQDERQFLRGHILFWFVYVPIIYLLLFYGSYRSSGFIYENIASWRTKMDAWGLIPMTVALVFVSAHFGISWLYGFIMAVQEDERAVKMFFGNPIQQVESGPSFLPFGIFYLRFVPRKVVQIELYPADKLFLGDADVIPAGKVPPLRVTHKDDPAVNKDPLARTLTSEIKWFIRFRITNCIEFIRNIGTIADASQQIEDTTAAVLQVEMSKRTNREARLELEQINRKIVSAANKLTITWGVTLEVGDGKIKEIGLGHTLNKKLQEVAEAQTDKEKAILTSEGEKVRLSNEGRGKADALKFLLEAKAEGLAAMTKTLGTVEQVQINQALEAYRDAIATGKQTYVLGDALKVVGEVLSKIKAVV